MRKGLQTKSHLLVDYENVQRIDLAALPDGFRVTIFVGCGQKTIPVGLVQNAQKLGRKLEWIKLAASGANALDFYIAYYLGRRLSRSPKTVCVILSGDSGFDPLLYHLKQQGFCCHRISSLSELEIKPKNEISAPYESNYERVLRFIAKTEFKSRPARRAALLNHICAMFSQKLSEEEATAVIKQLFDEGKVTENNEMLSYFF